MKTPYVRIHGRINQVLGSGGVWRQRRISCERYDNMKPIIRRPTAGHKVSRRMSLD
ncbi:hypothetical protein [Candidatus Nitrospira nitrosa]|uniref:hypothetical protein n=1 Tax=Candidatus Nitrospira nitrosa TaxID=1742972 RepID=UPI000B009132|nr:hypothetical protein [Candidatus Nitrospira nitrosa]